MEVVDLPHISEIVFIRSSQRTCILAEILQALQFDLNFYQMPPSAGFLLFFRWPDPDFYYNMIKSCDARSTSREVDVSECRIHCFLHGLGDVYWLYSRRQPLTCS